MNEHLLCALALTITKYKRPNVLYIVFLNKDI